VIFDKAYCEECVSHMLAEISEIDEVKVDVLELKIKVIKQISKSSPSGETITHLISDDIKDIKAFGSYSSNFMVELEFKKVVAYDFQHNAKIGSIAKEVEHVKGWKLLIENL